MLNSTVRGDGIKPHYWFSLQQASLESQKVKLSENHTPQVKAMERAEGFCSGQGGKHAVSVKELSKKDAPNLIGEEFSEFRMLFECLPDKSGKTQPRSDDVLNRIYGL
ncbi:MAG: hypothetical protein GY934_16240 [Gammaproteobacteria bacterium]|nr:hypothetical protein [Gammaproteobacteria bacterium]